MTEQSIYKQILADPALRKYLSRNSHYWFFHLYFSKHINYETATFQREMIALTENDNIKTAEIIAFRGSAKTTIMALSYPLWAMIGKQQKKFILILSQTQVQSRLILTNIKQELETNEMLIYDFGPFYEDADEWRANSLVIPTFGTRISAISSGEALRGIKHREHRPDLIIADDVENLDSSKTKEGRDKIFTWFTGEVLPAGQQNTKTIIIGNLLHEDCLVMRLKKLIEEKKFSATFKKYPLFDDKNRIAWLGKYPNMTVIDQEKKKIASEVAWQREYLLHLVPEENQVVKPQWLHYYDYPLEDSKLRYIATGIDLAISQRESADKTAMVSAKIFGYDEDLKIFILPNPINKRLSFPETFEIAKTLSTTLGNGQQTELFIEDVGYQRSLAQQLENASYFAKGVKILGDKRERLALVTHLIEHGNILFPKQGCEELIEQLLGFGIEKHDDLIDAFTILIHAILEKNDHEPGMFLDTDYENPSPFRLEPFNPNMIF